MNYICKSPIDYFLSVATTGLAIIFICKDWGTFKSRWPRWCALVLTLSIGFLSIAILYKNDHEIGRLESALKTSNDNLIKTTQVFINAFDKLNKSFGDLKTQIKTEELRQQVETLQTELASTRKALIKPKANLALTFAKSETDDQNVRSKSLPVVNDVVHLEFSVINQTDTPADDVGVTFRISSGCEYAKEPKGFRKLEGQPENHRYRNFAQIPAKSRVPTMSVDIKVPSKADRMDVGIIYRCSNCDVPDPNNPMVIGKVYLKRQGINLPDILDPKQKGLK